MTKERSSEGLYSGCSRAERPLRVFVFLAHGFGGQQWTERWSRGEIPGINESLPYGYHHAAGKHCAVEHSEDANEKLVTKLARRGMRELLGFDIIHAWRNRKALFEADIVWTHQEQEHLAVLALWQFRRRDHRPKLIAQCISLFDRWHRFSAPKRWLYRWLLNQADAITVHSPENLKFAREIFPQVRSEFVPFGINSDTMVAPAQVPAHHPVRLVALGNDRHRDWDTLIESTAERPEYVLRIASRRWRARRSAKRVANAEVIPAKSATAVSELYAWADIAVVPLLPNLHASGCTVIIEAVLNGKPVVCTDTGGLRAYFSEDEVRYVPPQDPAALNRALHELARDDQMRFAMSTRAQVRMLSAGLSSRAYAHRHYEISRELMDGAARKESVRPRSVA